MIKKIRLLLRNNYVLRNTVYPLVRYVMNDLFHWREHLVQKYGAEVISKVQIVSRSLNCMISPYFGTLLGIVRDGGLIKHDKDMDFIIEPDFVNIAKLVECLQKHGFAFSRFITINGVPTEISMRYKELSVDFFLVGHNVSCTRYIFAILDRGEVRVHTYPIINALVEKHTDMGDVFIPDNAEAHLTNEYGNWMTPNKNWDSSRGPSFCGLLKSSAIKSNCIANEAEIIEYLNMHKEVQRLDARLLISSLSEGNMSLLQ